MRRERRRSCVSGGDDQPLRNWLRAERACSAGERGRRRSARARTPSALAYREKGGFLGSLHWERLVGGGLLAARPKANSPQRRPPRYIAQATASSRTGWRSCFNRGTGSQIKSGGSHGAWHVAARTRQQHVPVQANACAATSHAVYLGGRGCRTRIVSNSIGSMLQAHTTTKIRTRRWSIQPRTLLGCRAKLLCNHATGWGGPVAQRAAGA